MNLYVSLINETIDYIEDNINERMTLEDLSQRFCISEFHFNRMFRTVAGRTLKQYVLGRKLTMAMEQLRNTDKQVIDIAYDIGFEYPEVFSRAFKKQFGISPNIFRKDKPQLSPVTKASLVERDIVNYQGSLTLKGTGVYLQETELAGVRVDVNEYDAGFESILNNTGDEFLRKAQSSEDLKKDKLYALVNCSGEDDGSYSVFYGMASLRLYSGSSYITRRIPQGWYQMFLYSGHMFEIREIFTDDLYRWVMVKEAELVNNGIGMINIFGEDYPVTREVQILVPVKSPR